MTNHRTNQSMKGGEKDERNSEKSVDQPIHHWVCYCGVDVGI